MSARGMLADFNNMTREETAYNIIEDAFSDFMLNHPTVVKYINDDEFIKEIYQSLTNATVHVNPNKILAQCTTEQKELVFRKAIELGNEIFDVSRSFRSAAGFCANLRNFHLGTDEDYMDWYCCAPECYLSCRIAEIYDELGIEWTIWDADD